MSSTPVPAPRNINSQETKKPIPTPRQLIPLTRQKSNESNSSKCSDENTNSTKGSDGNTNTFSRRVRTLSNASKQIAEDIGDLVHERKRAVIEGTRQSVRRIARRFTSASIEQHVQETKNAKDLEDTIDVFNSIKFQSPINLSDSNIYKNVSNEEEVVSLPPPLYPPPPLREESVYDEPQSVTSGSTGSSGRSPPPQVHIPENYESVFPAYPYNSDSDSCIDMTMGTIDNKVDLTRSGSWKFYDQVPKTENIYNNVDSTPPLEPIISEVTDELSDATSSSGSQDIRNSLYYENHELANSSANTRPTKSIILQFDPLSNTVTETDSKIEENKKILEQLLQGDLYSNITNAGTYDNWSLSNESDSGEYINPPPPPARFDSLPDAPPPTPTRKERGRSTWFTDSNNQKPATSNESKPMLWFKQVNDVLKKAPEVVKGVKNKENLLARPTLGPKNAVQHKSILYKVQNGPVDDLFGEFSSRWCVVENGHFVCYSDNSCDNIKEHFPLESILSVQILMDQKYKYRYENDELHCFELNTSGKSRGGYIYGSRSISERRVWMQRIAESLTHRFSAKVISDYTRIGWAYIREGVCGQWAGAWIILAKRCLYYAIDNAPVQTIDLRKARCVVLQAFQENDNNPKTNDKGPNMLVDCTSGALYLRMWTSRETKVWCHIIRLAAHNNGANLDQQQLTKNDIPVIVEKSINFIYAHGSMSEGIYRRAGSGQLVSEILSKFRKDAWAVQLTSDKYSEHDVATALKRFFRDLPEPLLTSTNRQYLYQVSLVTNNDEKIRLFKAAFDHFPPIYYKTAKRLLGHLHFINSQSNRNRMNVENLSSLWGPTLMHYDEKDSSESSMDPQKASEVVAQLIKFYSQIFPEEPGEAEQERIMLEVLERCIKSPQGAVSSKVSGDFRVWIYLHNKEGATFNVAIGPQKSAYDVCVELAPKIKLLVHELVLEEHVLDGKLVRPVHHSEKVLDVVLRWGYWDESDRKDNCLILSQIAKYWEFIQDKPVPVSGELKYADSKTKNFKMYMFEFSQAKLSIYKDRLSMTKLASWNIEDIIWFLGNESKRNPQSKWTLTFIEKDVHPKRTKTTPWFGNVIAWSDPSLRATWIGAMLKSRYPTDLMPPPLHVNLMST